MPLTSDQVEKFGPRRSGLYEVKVERRLIDYPGGRSAMVHYGTSDENAPSVREALYRDWLSPEVAENRLAWEEYGPLGWRFALTSDVAAEHARRMTQFVERFGRAPWGNGEAVGI